MLLMGPTSLRAVHGRSEVHSLLTLRAMLAVANGGLDGVRNPAVDVGTDRQAIGSVCYSVPSLAFAWYFTNNSAYSTHAGNILRRWFINSTTAMNPNLDHGQVITCSNTGRSIGIIDFRPVCVFRRN